MAAVCWLPTHHPYRRLMRTLGFLDSRRSTGALVAPYSLDPSELAFLAEEHSRVHLTIGDSDLV